MDFQPFLDTVRIRELIPFMNISESERRQTFLFWVWENFNTKLNGRTRTYCRHNLRQFKIINKMWGRLVKFTKFWLRKFYSNKVNTGASFSKKKKQNKNICINYSQKKPEYNSNFTLHSVLTCVNCHSSTGP